MATLKDLFWPHEYSPPWVSFKYYTKRCTTEGCWKKAIISEPYHACPKHAEEAGRFIDLLRANYNADPLWRLQIAEQTKQYKRPPSSVYWRMSRLWRKERR